MKYQYRWIAILWTLVIISCRPLDMYDQAKYEAYEGSGWFADGKAMRIPPEGTVPERIGRLEGLQSLQTSDADFSFQVFDEKRLKKGKDKFEVFCAPCHGIAGFGDGLVVQRGFTKPPSLHNIRLKSLSAEYYKYVIENGIGAMPAYKIQIPTEEQWNIIAFIQVLQMSQAIHLETLPENMRGKFK